MTTVGQIEKRTQAHIVALFQQRLGYDYLGDKHELDNSNIEPKLLTGWLNKQGVSDTLISRALLELNKVATDASKSLYDRNREVYELLRYGIKVRLPDPHPSRSRIIGIRHGTCGSGVPPLPRQVPIIFPKKWDIAYTGSGFLTGTPLLKADKQKSIEVFGRYIHTHKFRNPDPVRGNFSLFGIAGALFFRKIHIPSLVNGRKSSQNSATSIPTGSGFLKFDQVVREGVVLDLRYEARDIDQSITSQTSIDKWFEAKTQGLNDVTRAQLKQKWGTMQRVLSSQDRLQKIVADILMDMATCARLVDGHGNAMLVAGSIYEACKFSSCLPRPSRRANAPSSPATHPASPTPKVKPLVKA